MNFVLHLPRYGENHQILRHYATKPLIRRFTPFRKKKVSTDPCAGFFNIRKQKRVSAKRHDWILLLFFWSWTQVASAELRSTSGNIFFSVQGESLGLLNVSGLKVGNASSPQAKLDVSGHALVSENLTIGSPTTSNSNLFIGGSFSMAPQNVTSDSNVEEHSMILVNSSLEDVLVNLPDAQGCPGRIFTIKKTSPLHRVRASSNSLIDDKNMILFPAASADLDHISVVSSGNQWYILDSSSQAFQTLHDEFHDDSRSDGTHPFELDSEWYSMDDFTGTYSIAVSSGCLIMATDNTNNPTPSGGIVANLPSNSFVSIGDKVRLEVKLSAISTYVNQNDGLMIALIQTNQAYSADTHVNPFTLPIPTDGYIGSFATGVGGYASSIRKSDSATPSHCPIYGLGSDITSLHSDTSGNTSIIATAGETQTFSLECERTVAGVRIVIEDGHGIMSVDDNASPVTTFDSVAIGISRRTGDEQGVVIQSVDVIWSPSL